MPDWLILSGWIIFASQMANGDFAWCDKWQEYAHDIDNYNVKELCVPISPFGVVYEKNCSVLNKDIDSITAIDK